MNEQKFGVRKWLWIVLATVIVLGGGFTYWYVYGNKGTTTTKTSPTPVKTATISPSANIKNSPTPIDTTNWKTYSDGSYGYEIKYPTNWQYKIISKDQIEFTETGKTYQIEGLETYLVGIFIRDNTKNQTPIEIANELKSTLGEAKDKAVILERQVSGLDAAFISYFNTQKQTIIVKNDKIFKFVSLVPNIEEIYGKMLKTLKFL